MLCHNDNGRWLECILSDKFCTFYELEITITTTSSSSIISITIISASQMLNALHLMRTVQPRWTEDPFCYDADQVPTKLAKEQRRAIRS